MNITKAYVIFFLVMILTKSLSNSNVLASSVVESAKKNMCYVPCTHRYSDWECFHDCFLKDYNDGRCVAGRCCCIS
ncbi:unnamed protein product [Thlaspi arvense]|uniref:Defensin-like domain-containing protein n=1 Tax=Thlaspi arvense TaxID=13288 RepID=A0AAU9S4Q8_THLAR|nr:unnamed protein product [Thlaspi arvense]